MKTLTHGGRQYMPRQNAQGKLLATAVAAYGSGMQRGQMMFTVYLQVSATVGPKLVTYKVSAMRRFMNKEEATIPAQRKQLEFMLDVVATQQDCELVLVQEMSLR